MSFDESMRKALEAAASAKRSNDGDVDEGDLGDLARSAAFFETLALLCRRAPPPEVFRAAGKSEEEGEEDEDFPRPQRTLLAALAASASLLGSGGGSKSGYESRVLKEFAKRSAFVADRLAEALASSLVEDGGGGEREEESRRPRLQASFFGFEDLSPGERPTLEVTKSFPVVSSSARDLLSGGTGKALWPASRALASALLSRRFGLISGDGGRGRTKRATSVVELGAGVGLVGAALCLGGEWWRRRRREEEGGEGEGDDDEKDDDEKDDDDDENSPSFSLWLTDGDADAVGNSLRTLESNGIREGESEDSSLRVRVSRLDWREAEKETEPRKDQNLLVVGSDITYDPPSAPALAKCLRSLLSGDGEGNGRAVLAGVVRSGETASAFERAFSDEGLSFSCGSRPPSPPAQGGGEERKGASERRVRAWHAGDEGVELRWWSVRL